MIFDTHCHLNTPELFQKNEKVIKDAFDVGVRKMIIPGFDKKSSLLAIKIAEMYDFCYAAIGFHPTEIFDISDSDFYEVFSQIHNPKVVAIGEIGLDYYWVKEAEKREMQKEFFIKQIKIANEYNLPIIVHNRDAIDDCYKILKEHTPIALSVMHCYSGSVELMQEFIKLNFMISLGGPVTFTNAKTPKEVARVVPLDKLLVETDSPYLSPHPLRGTENCPANIVYTIDEIANLKNITPDEIKHSTYTNACKVFKLC